MAIFEGIKYHYYDENNKLLGTSNGFLGGLKLFPESAYVNKHIDGEFKESIVIYVPEPKNETVKS